jgi:hypothetical protein
MALQIRRGPTADRLSYTPVVGELVWDTQLNSLYIGNGSSAGGLPAGTLVPEDVQDIASTMLTSGSHQYITFTYDDALGRINSTFDLSAFNGVQPGQSYNINVIGDDSSTIVNALNRTVSAPGGLIGPIFTNLIDSSDSSTITVTPATIFDSNVTVGGDVFLNNLLNVISNVPSETAALFQTVGDHNTSLNISLAKARGTFASPTPVVNGDQLGNIIMQGYSNGQFINVSAILTRVDGAVSGSTIPSTLLFATTSSAGELLTRVEIDSTGRVSMLDGAEIFVSDDTVIGDSNLRALRARGTTLSPTTVLSGDNLFNIVTSGYAGTAYNPAASISFQAEGTITSTAVPGKIVFTTADSAGTLTTRMTIDSAGRVTSLGGITLPNNSVNTDMIIMSNYHSTGTNANNLAFRRGRGTSTSPTVIQSSDRIYDINWGGYDGSTHTTACAIQGLVSTAAVSSGVVPGQLSFVVANNAGSLSTRLSVDAYVATFNVAPRVPNFSDDTAANAAVLTPLAGMMYFDTTLSKGKMYDGAAWQQLF